MNMQLEKAILWIVPARLLAGNCLGQSSYDVRSPDKRIEQRMRTAQQIRYDVVLNGAAVLRNSTSITNHWVLADTLHFGRAGQPV